MLLDVAPLLGVVSWDLLEIAALVHGTVCCHLLLHYLVSLWLAQVALLSTLVALLRHVEVRTDRWQLTVLSHR